MRILVPACFAPGVLSGGQNNQIEQSRYPLSSLAAAERLRAWFDRNQLQTAL